MYFFVSYLLNPYTIGSCVAHSTVLFTNLAVTFAVLYALKGRFILLSEKVSMKVLFGKLRAV